MLHLRCRGAWRAQEGLMINGAAYPACFFTRLAAFFSFSVSMACFVFFPALVSLSTNRVSSRASNKAQIWRICQNPPSSTPFIPARCLAPNFPRSYRLSHKKRPATPGGLRAFGWLSTREKNGYERSELLLDARCLTQAGCSTLACLWGQSSHRRRPSALPGEF